MGACPSGHLYGFSCAWPLICLTIYHLFGIFCGKLTSPMLWKVIARIILGRMAAIVAQQSATSNQLSSLQATVATGKYKAAMRTQR